jgi:hypothetical protein
VEVKMIACCKHSYCTKSTNDPTGYCAGHRATFLSVLGDEPILVDGESAGTVREMVEANPDVDDLVADLAKLFGSNPANVVEIGDGGAAPMFRVSRAA